MPYSFTRLDAIDVLRCHINSLLDRKPFSPIGVSPRLSKIPYLEMVIIGAYKT